MRNEADGEKKPVKKVNNAREKFYFIFSTVKLRKRERCKKRYKKRFSLCIQRCEINIPRTEQRKKEKKKLSRDLTMCRISDDDDDDDDKYDIIHKTRSSHKRKGESKQVTHVNL